MPSGLSSLKLKFDRSKLESLCDVAVTRIGDTFPTVFRRLSKISLSDDFSNESYETMTPYVICRIPVTFTLFSVHPT